MQSGQETKSIQAPEGGLFLFDFDQTISCQHTNSILLDATIQAAIAFIKQHNPEYPLKDLNAIDGDGNNLLVGYAYLDELDNLSIEAARLKLKDKPGVDFEALSQSEQILSWNLDEEQQWEVISNVEPRGGIARWKELFEKIWADGHQIGIATNNEYPIMVLRYLNEKIGLSAEQVAKICITKGRFRTDVGKNRHIDQTLNQLKRDRNDKYIVLVEDSIEAIELGHKHKKLHKDGGILAPTDEKDEDPSKAKRDLKYYVTYPHIEATARVSEQLKKEIAEARVTASKASEAVVAREVSEGVYSSGLTMYSPAAPVNVEKVEEKVKTFAPPV